MRRKRTWGIPAQINSSGLFRDESGTHHTVLLPPLQRLLHTPLGSVANKLTAEENTLVLDNLQLSVFSSSVLP